MKIVQAIEKLVHDMKVNGEVIHTETWQGIDISEKPQAKMVEILHRTVSAEMPTGVSLESLAVCIGANWPWAENHFQERVGFMPINPGIEWKNWPWGNHATNSLDADGKFNHNYMERYWPKYAGQKAGPSEVPDDYRQYIYTRRNMGMPPQPIRGIYGDYGDLGNLIELLIEQPLTRQAYLPVWFPEDTGTANTGRKPCTLGYHFIMRNGKLDVTYYIRSCDLSRHFRDDIYLTLRLAYWILDQCQAADHKQVWDKVVPGNFTMHITSLHMFIADYQMMFKRNPS